MFLLITCHNQDVIPLPSSDDINDIRIRQLSISIEYLRRFYKKQSFLSIDSFLKTTKLGIGKVYRI